MAGRSGHRGSAGPARPADTTRPADTAGPAATTGSVGRRGPAAAPRSTMLTSGSRRGCSVMACWQRNWQLTHPPVAARRCRTDRNIVNATAAASAAPPTAIAIAANSAAESRKCPIDRPNTRNTTSNTAAILIAGRA
jgi:hypothetical protein